MNLPEKSVLRGKRGSYTVLAVIIFSAVMILVSAAVYSAGQNAISGTADGFGRLWGRSILAEYDRVLKDRYGIFAYYGNPVSVGEKLDMYAAYSFGDKEYIDYEISGCSMEEYSLADIENFGSQIKTACVAAVKPEAFGIAGKAAADGGYAAPAGDGGTYGKRYISNSWIIEGLPSKGRTGGIGIASLAEKLKNGQTGSSASAIGEDVYIFRFFKDYTDERDLGETYFKNEIEYVISGKANDEEAREKVYTYISLIRNVLNLAYLYTSDEKRDAAFAAAELLTPGYAAYLTQALMLEAWAYMEARNDMKLLYAGKSVPLIKRDENWALSLENFVSYEYGIDSEGNEEEPGERYEEKSGYVEPQKTEGIDYGNYLGILVGAMSRETKLLRVMDLIQINMKYLYSGGFLISDYYTGLEYKITVNGREHEFAEKY